MPLVGEEVDMKEFEVLGVMVKDGTIDSHFVVVDPSEIFIEEETKIAPFLLGTFLQLIIMLIERRYTDAHGHVESFVIAFYR